MRNFRRTTLITALSLSVLIGLGLSRKLSFTPQTWLLVFSPLLLLLRAKSITSLLIVVVLGTAIGLWRGGIYMQNVYQLRALSGQKVTIEATASTDAVYSTRSQIEFTANQAVLIGGPAKAIAGSFKISGFGVPMVYRGDRVRVSGKLFPMRGSNQARIAYAQLERLSAGQNVMNAFTRKFNAGMQSALPEPQASFGLGLLIGQRTTLPAQITAALTAVGLVHIVAVSGYNLTILVRGVGRLKLGSKYQKLVTSLALITGFVLITGFSASIVRAALVSILSLWAWYYGRRIKPVVLISFAAAVTGLWNPFYVWGDLGWYLSFLAFFGVLVIAPLIAGRFFRHQPKLLTMVLLETLSAEIMTLPLILMTFSQLSIVALIANLLVVPLVPLAMLFSAAAGLAGAFIPAAAGWFALPARLLLTYMLDIVHLLSSVPSALVHRSISLVYMAILYCLVLLIILVIHKKVSKQSQLLPDETSAITP
jgi:competence protein ComEC